jgi:hypothetical protein
VCAFVVEAPLAVLFCFVSALVSTFLLLHGLAMRPNSPAESIIEELRYAEALLAALGFLCSCILVEMRLARSARLTGDDKNKDTSGRVAFRFALSRRNRRKANRDLHAASDAAAALRWR